MELLRSLLPNSRAVCVLTLAACFGACRPPVSSPEANGPELLSVERLVFVPAGDGHLGTLRWANPAALLVDRCEVPRSVWRELAAAPGEEELAATIPRWDQSPAATDAWPVTHVSLDEARRAAALRGMRLPTVEEWLYCAVGKTGGPWPWGTGRKSSAANTSELRLGQPVPVGTFENGRTRTGLYDLLGNVWEWTEGPNPERPGADPAWRWVVGGSFAWRGAPIIDRSQQDLLALEREADYWASDLGFRCVVDARAFLSRAEVREWSLPVYRDRLRAVGRRWGPAAIGLLDELARGGPLALGWLLEGARQ